MHALRRAGEHTFLCGAECDQQFLGTIAPGGNQRRRASITRNFNQLPLWVDIAIRYDIELNLMRDCILYGGVVVISYYMGIVWQQCCSQPIVLFKIALYEL